MDEELTDLLSNLCGALQDMLDTADAVCTSKNMSKKLEPLVNDIENAMERVEELFDYVLGEPEDDEIGMGTKLP